MFVEEGKDLIKKIYYHGLFSLPDINAINLVSVELNIYLRLLTEKHRNSSHWAWESQSQRRMDQQVSMVTEYRLGRGRLGESKNLKVKVLKLLSRTPLCAYTDPPPLGLRVYLFSLTKLQTADTQQDR